MIEETAIENLIKNAKTEGQHLLEDIKKLEQKYPNIISNARGRGLMCAFDLPSSEIRDKLKAKLYNNGLVVIGCGELTIRFRPALVITSEEIDKAIKIIDDTLLSF